MILDFALAIVISFILFKFRSNSSIAGPIFALIIMIVRTILDYIISWHFYFPS
jgi:hypothetical protein